jgi:tetratricopeptide (TPR) repeat protein
MKVAATDAIASLGRLRATKPIVGRMIRRALVGIRRDLDREAIPLSIAEGYYGKHLFLDAPVSQLRHLSPRLPEHAFLAEKSSESLLRPVSHTAIDQEMADLADAHFDFRHTEAYAQLMQLARAGSPGRRNFVPLAYTAAIDWYFLHYLDLIRSIAANGMVPQSSLASARLPSDFDKQVFRAPGERKIRDIGVMIDRDGQLLRYGDGYHRFAIARMLGLATVPVQVLRVHGAWAVAQVDSSAQRPERALAVAFDKFGASLVVNTDKAANSVRLKAVCSEIDSVQAGFPHWPSMKAKRYRKPQRPGSARTMTLTVKAHIAANRGHYRRALAHWRQAVRQNPSDPYAAAHVGITLTRIDKVDDAIDQLRAVIDRWPDNLLALRSLAPLLRHEDNWTEALGLWQRIVSLDQGDAAAVRNLGRLLSKTGQFDKAVQLLSGHATRNPTDIEARRALGLVLNKQESWSDALDVWDALANDVPDDARFPLFAARALDKLRAFDAAERRLTQILERWPARADALELAGRVCESNRSWEGARDAWSRLLEIEPENTRAMIGVGRALREMGHLDEAEITLRRALEIHPELHEARRNLGLVLNSDSRWSESLPVWRGLCRTNEDDLHARLQLVNACLETGQIRSARKYFDCSAIRKASDNPRVASLAREIDRLASEQA